MHGPGAANPGRRLDWQEAALQRTRRHKGSLVLLGHAHGAGCGHHQALQKERLRSGERGQGAGVYSCACSREEAAGRCGERPVTAGTSTPCVLPLVAAPSRPPACVASTTGLSAALLKSRMATEQPGRSTRCSSCGRSSSVARSCSRHIPARQDSAAKPIRLFVQA